MSPRQQPTAGTAYGYSGYAQQAMDMWATRDTPLTPASQAMDTRPPSLSGKLFGLSD